MFIILILVYKILIEIVIVSLTSVLLSLGPFKWSEIVYCISYVHCVVLLCVGLLAVIACTCDQGWSPQAHTHTCQVLITFTHKTLMHPQSGRFS